MGVNAQADNNAKMHIREFNSCTNTRAIKKSSVLIIPTISKNVNMGIFVHLLIVRNKLGLT